MVKFHLSGIDDTGQVPYCWISWSTYSVLSSHRKFLHVCKIGTSYY